MAYVKQTWINLPDKTTPISAERLNHIEDGIETIDLDLANIDEHLTDYIKNTDYATSDAAGIIRSDNGLNVSSINGKANCSERTYAQYTTDGNNFFISKGTLENVITGKDLTTKTYVDDLVGDIGETLDEIQREVI